MTQLTPFSCRSLLPLCLLAVSGQALSDWQADREAWQAGWRNGKIVAIETLDHKPLVPANCPAAEMPNGVPYQRVSLRYTQTRRSHVAQLILPTSVPLVTGTTLRFNRETCATQPQQAELKPARPDQSA